MNQFASVARAAVKAAGEHGLLRRLLAQVEAAFAGPTPFLATGPDVVAAKLDELRGPLRAHFDEEERAGLFEQIQERAPEHAHACSRLREEHHALLRRIDTLRAVAPLDRRQATWGREVRALLDDLASHESRESEILTSALDGSTPAVD
jgi:hypothetical protein